MEDEISKKVPKLETPPESRADQAKREEKLEIHRLFGGLVGNNGAN